MWVEILKTGSYKDNDGRPVIISQETIDEMIQGYNPKLNAVPVSIGPIKGGSPAWAWVEEFKRDGSVLFASLRDVVPEFAELLKAKAFTKRAVTFTGFGALRTISFLGAEPPVLKDLEGFDFYSGPATTYEFTENDFFTGNPSDRLSILVHRKQVEKPDLSYSSAFSEVQKDNPELTWAYIEELSHHHKKRRK